MSKTNKQYFHFTLGPVQSFVGQARRTRDFWAGSFLLSWLSGVAMQSAISQGGVMKFPKADEDFLNAINGKGDNKPQQGSIPNRFKVEVDESFNPQQVINDVQIAWKTLAYLIYEKEIKDHALKHTQAIWNRQIQHFWEMIWVLVEDEKNSKALDCRKNWRSQYFPEEAGIKCSLMGDWQELSGIEGVRSKHNTTRKSFWKTIANENGKNDFADKEMLCAMSYVKRRFVKYFETFKVNLSGFTAHGWKLPSAVPSVAYIAAAPWFGNVLKNADEADIRAFYSASNKLYDLSEYESNIKCIEDAHKNKQYKGIDGNAFHEIALDNINITPDQNKAKPVKVALKKLKDDFGDISPFYAVLMMDGDSLGKQMSDTTKQDKITTGLAKFTRKVPQLVQDNNGFLIYAGGDDVLALVTLENALDCALAIRTHYQDCFKDTDIKTSISASIIYTHINSPLKNILHESHQLLDDVAKEGAGRDAFAVRVYKGSGLALECAKTWNKALNDAKTALKIDEIIEQFSPENNYIQFSSKFFYKIRERFELLYGKDNKQENPLTEEQAVKFMAMEYLQSLDDDNLKIQTAEAIIRPLLKQCKNAGKNNQVTADFALLVRFLAQKGIEGGRS